MTMDKTAMQKALDLPEIRTRIGWCITDLNTLLICSRVCSTWHATFFPLTWRTIHASSYTPSTWANSQIPDTPTFDPNTLACHRLKIQELTLDLHPSLVPKPDVLLKTFIPQCSNLCSLSWRIRGSGHGHDGFHPENKPFYRLHIAGSRGYGFPEKEFFRFHRTGAWPYLDSLEIQGTWMFLHDFYLARFIRDNRRLVKKLNVPHSGFGQGALQALKERPGQLAWIQELDLSRCPGVSSEMVQDLLCSCSGLIKFSACSVDVMGVLKGEPWACLGLKALRLHFDFRYDSLSLLSRPALDTTAIPGHLSGQAIEQETNTQALVLASSFEPVLQLDGSEYSQHQRAIFQRLAQFTRLETLHLDRPGGWRYRLPPGISSDQANLQILLEAGLRELSALKNLKRFVLPQVGTWHLGEEELLWMMDYWPDLLEVSVPAFFLVLKPSGTLANVEKVLLERGMTAPVWWRPFCQKIEWRRMN